MPVQTRQFLVTILISGALAGLVYGTANHLLVQPYLDVAIGLEAQGALDAGLEDAPGFWVEYQGYRDWQKGGQFVAGLILGVSFGSLFGIVYALSRDSIPGDDDRKKAVVLAALMWCVLYVVPFLKYPASLPGTGDPATVAVRTASFLALVAISGLGALGFYKVSRRLAGRARPAALLGYVGLVAALFYVLPDTGGLVSDLDLENRFRAASVTASVSFWMALGLLSGTFWRALGVQRD